MIWSQVSEKHLAAHIKESGARGYINTKDSSIASNWRFKPHRTPFKF